MKNARGVHRDLKPVQQVPPRSYLFPGRGRAVPTPGCPFGFAGMPACELGCGTEPGREHCLVRSGTGEQSRDHHRETFLSPPCPAVPWDHGVREPGLSPSRGYSPHFAAGRVSRRLWSGGLIARWPGTALPLSQRSAVRLISVRRFASVCAPMCVCVWSCLAFSMQVTPSRACSRSPRPGRQQAGRETCPHPSPPPRPPLPPLRRGAALRSSNQRSFCLP